MKVTYLQNYPIDPAFSRAGQHIELWQAEDGEYLRFHDYGGMEEFTILHRSGNTLVHYYFHLQSWKIDDDRDRDWWGEDFWQDPSNMRVLDEEYLIRRNIPRFSPGDIL